MDKQGFNPILEERERKSNVSTFQRYHLGRRSEVQHCDTFPKEGTK